MCPVQWHLRYMTVFIPRVQRGRATRILHIGRRDRCGRSRRDRIAQSSLLEHALLDANSVLGIVREYLDYGEKRKLEAKHALPCILVLFMFAS